MSFKTIICFDGSIAPIRANASLDGNDPTQNAACPQDQANQAIRKRINLLWEMCKTEEQRPNPSRGESGALIGIITKPPVNCDAIKADIHILMKLLKNSNKK